MKKWILLLVILLPLVDSGGATAHSGGTNALGCHTNHSTGSYTTSWDTTANPPPVTYCHVIRGQSRCGYARSTCRALVAKYGGRCTQS